MNLQLKTKTQLYNIKTKTSTQAEVPKTGKGRDKLNT